MFSAVGLFILLWLSPTIPRIRAENDKPVIREHPLDVLVDKNDPATLRCNVTGDNVKITWYKDDQPVNIGNAAHRLILPNGSLFLLRADHDLGTYHCTASNDHGEVSSQSAHVRQASLREEFRVRPHNVNAVLGQKAILECSPPRGFPEPSVSWRKDDEPLEDDRRFQLDPSGNLVIENVQRSDSGVYQCVAMNMVGERVSGPARLSVSEKPRFLVEPKDALSEVNTSVVFDCRVAGEPSPTISWKKRNCVPVMEGGKCSDSMPIGRAYITDDSRGLQIDRVQPEDEGDYVCVAKNSAGEIETSAKLRVQAPPKIVKAPKNQKLKPGETAEFECEVTGRPAPGVVWSKEGERRFTLMSGQDLNGRIEVSPAGTLRIKEVNELDVGNYVCAAVNSVGSALKKTMLTLEMDAANAVPPPQITYGPSNQTLLTHDIAILPCQFTPAPPGRDPPNVSWFHNSIPINRDDHRFSVSPSGTLKITDLSKEDAGNYTCQVESAYGYNSWSGYLQVEEHTNPSAVFERMPDRSQLPAAPSQPRVTVRRPNQIDIEWDPPTNHGASPVTHYTLQYWNPTPGSKTTWTTVNDRINGLKYRLVGVQQGQQYFFIVRANNALGMGEPSPMSQMALTYADQEPKESSTPETTVTLQKPVRLTHAKTINSSTALLTWTNGEGLNNDGFYLTWRGPPLANGETIMNITEPKVSSVLVNGLKPYSTYDFFLIPYKNSMNLSPSNSIELRTPEGIPDPPRNVFARMENLTSVLISFGPPAEIRGILKGFDIQFRDNSSENVNTIRTRANARSVTLRNLAPNRSYQAHVAALNGEGRSEYVSTELFTMNEATLQRHHQLYGRHETAVSPWKIGAGAGFLALFLALGAILAFCWCRYGGGKKRKNSLRHRPPSTDFIKINDGSVATGREEYWPESAMPFHIPPPPPPPNGLAHQCSGMTVHSHMANMNGQMNMSSPRSAHYFHHHPCCAPMMNAYGTTVRPHYSGPYCAGSSTLGREEGQYHYAVLPPTSTLPHHAIMHYEDDPSPYASTTVTSSGYGPPVPSNPPPMFIPQQLQQNFPPNGSIRRTATQPAQSNNSSANLQGRRTPRTNPHFFNEVPAPAPQQDMELGRILAQVPPPPTQTYDSVTEDFMNVPKEEGNKDLPNRTTNSRSPPRSRNGTADHEERFLLK